MVVVTVAKRRKAVVAQRVRAAVVFWAKRDSEKERARERERERRERKTERERERERERKRE